MEKSIFKTSKEFEKKLMRKIRKKSLRTKLLVGIGISTSFAIVGVGMLVGSGISYSINNHGGNIRNHGSNDSTPGRNNGNSRPDDGSDKNGSNDNSSATDKLIAKAAYDAIKETAEADAKSDALPSTVAKDITTLAKANEQIAENSNRIPDAPDFFEYVISAVANDEKGTLTIKVALKKAFKARGFFTTQGDPSTTKVDKDVVVTGYQTTQQADKIKVKAAYDGIPPTANSFQKTGILPSAIAKDITTLDNANDQISAADSNFIPDVPDGFEYLISAVADDENGNLIIKVAIKKANTVNGFFTTEGDPSDTKVDKDVVISGYQKTREADKITTKAAYDAIKLNANANIKPGTVVFPSNVADEVKTLAKANEQIAAKNDKIPNAPAGFEYVISAEAKNTEGKLFVKISLKKSSTGKYFNLNGDPVDPSSPTYVPKILTINGYKRESSKPLDYAGDPGDPDFYEYWNYE